MHHQHDPRPAPSRSLLRLPFHLPISLGILLLSLVAVSVPLASPAAAAGPSVPAPEIVPFQQWAPNSCPRPTGADHARVRRLVVHHTHEPVAATRAQVLPALALTCKAHTDRGFSSIGYHYVVDPWGGIYQGRGGMPDAKGRPPATHAQGAHVAGSNRGAVGVVFLGDHEDEPPTAAALSAATHLLAWLIQDTGTNPGAHVTAHSTGLGTARFNGTFHPRAVTGHSASNHTACPGEHLRALLSPIRDRMRQHLAGNRVSGWERLAVDGHDHEATPKEKRGRAERNGKKARTNRSRDGSGSGKNGDTGKGTRPAADETPARRAPTSRGADADAVPTAEAGLPMGPLISPAERLARLLRDSGLMSLADRVFDAPPVRADGRIGLTH